MKKLLITLLPVFLLACVLVSAEEADEAQEVKKGTYKIELDNVTYDVHVPDCYEPDGKAGLIMLLHGSGGTSISMVHAYLQGPWLTDLNLIAIAPQSKNAYWNPGDTEPISCLKDIQSKYKIDGKRVHLAGFSAGGIYAGWLGANNLKMFQTIAIFGAGMGEATTAKFKKAPNKPVYFINGEHCRFAHNAKADYAELVKMGSKNARLKILPGEQHSFNFVPHLPMVFDWVKAMESGYDYDAALTKAEGHAKKKKLDKAISLVSEIEKHPQEEVFWERLAKIKTTINDILERKLDALIKKHEGKPETAVLKLKEFADEYKGYAAAERALKKLEELDAA